MSIIDSPWYVGAVVLFLLFGLIFSKIRPAILFVGALLLVYLPSVITEQQMLVNATNPAVITLVLLLTVSVALEKAIFIKWLGCSLASSDSRYSLARLIGISGLMSAFANNTAIVAILMGAVQSSKKVLPSRLLLPLSYASIIGGVTTLVGTSTNLIVDAFVRDNGLPPLELFDFTKVGISVFFVCGLIMVIIGPWLLPKHQQGKESRNHNYFIEASVENSSSLIGKSVADNGFRNLETLFLVEIVRGDRLLSPVTPSEIIQQNDILVFTGVMDNVDRLSHFDGLKISDFYSDGLLKKNLVEAVISPNSSLIGKSIKKANFRSRFNAAVVAVRRGNEQIRGGLGHFTLSAGDVLVLAIGQDFYQRDNLDRNFVLINGVERENVLSPKDSFIAIAGFIIAIGASALNLISLSKALILLLTLFLVLRFVSVQELRRRLPLGLIVVIVSALGIAKAMVSSGLALIIAQFVLHLFSGGGDYGALVGLYLLTLILTEIITNNAAAALACPIALSLSQQLGISPMPLFMTVAFAASASFLSPYGYQTNLMVYSAGKYRFLDYLRFGLPICVAYSFLVIFSIPFFWPLN